MHDQFPEQNGGVTPVDELAAHQFNKEGFGIFHTVNSFKGTSRRLNDLVRINAWALDVDNFDKRLLLRKLSLGPVHPSRIIETKSGLHIYWNAVDAKPENYRSIVDDRLCYFYEGDLKAKDMARILRTPGFNHMKDPNNPFPIRVLFERNVAYTEKEMLSAFELPRMHEIQVQKKQELQIILKPHGTDLWEKVWNLDQRKALERLSGHEFVKGETYSFQRNRDNFNIWVNNKSTNCFIDKDGKIGSSSGGGPTIANWLNYFGYPWKRVAEILKIVFPELVEPVIVVEKDFVVPDQNQPAKEFKQNELSGF